uniref:Uncharacterized protein n=1 Tax=Meloidogyne enterolobii TaxID=390850 RepID=A0A6V7TUZ0_MELEN|nr:unnamed protein product [Meloidogyne enterolobii]
MARFCFQTSSRIKTLGYRILNQNPVSINHNRSIEILLPTKAGTSIVGEKMLIGEIYSTIIYYFATFGIFSNLFLIRLILRYTMKEMQVYSKILLQTCFVDILGICVFVVSQPAFISDNGTGIVWDYGLIHYLPNPWQSILLRINFFMGRVTTSNVSTLFVYRYFAVVRKVDIKFKHQLILIFGMIIPLLILSILSYIAYYPTPEKEHLTNYEVAKILELDNDTIKNYVIGLRTGTDDLSNFTGNFASALNIINYIIIIFCGISIQIHVYRHCKGVEMTRLRNMNKQLSIVLEAQVFLERFLKRGKFSNLKWGKFSK